MSFSQVAPRSPRLQGRSNRGQIPGLMLDPREHSRKDDEGGDNGCNNHCVNGRHNVSPFVSSCRREKNRALTWINFDLDQ
jgi:hypothetical protein